MSELTELRARAAALEVENEALNQGGAEALRIADERVRVLEEALRELVALARHAGILTRSHERRIDAALAGEPTQPMVEVRITELEAANRYLREAYLDHLDDLARVKAFADRAEMALRRIKNLPAYPSFDTPVEQLAGNIASAALTGEPAAPQPDTVSKHDWDCDGHTGTYRWICRRCHAQAPYPGKSSPPIGPCVVSKGGRE